MLSNCPGSQKFKQPQPETIKCSSCGGEIEIWTDEIKAVCPKCNNTVMREQGASCLDWCRYAKECVGEDIYNSFIQNKATTLKGQLIKELEDYFGEDVKRINHAKRVMHFAEELLKLENSDWHIVIPASILHDVGIKVSEQKYGSSAGHYQEKEGPAVARKILLKMGVKNKDIDEICEIIRYHHSPGRINTKNFKVLYDADLLVNLKDEADVKAKAKLEKIINKAFLTDTGRALAEKIYLA
jgi:HD superfamily phosphodiesterase/predicted RNA-binding Zn-ribbon protein involved in translation (DUF1610 family)